MVTQSKPLDFSYSCLYELNIYTLLLARRWVLLIVFLHCCLHLTPSLLTFYCSIQYVYTSVTLHVAVSYLYILYAPSIFVPIHSLFCPSSIRS
ncbi:hypothetical protein BJ165DRAFT_1435710 [Panaeolus papilionaceus]|nr:hypothetical protein BJ165DRAFT_1435710 [Panaeolus papilionaceus]